MRKPADVYYDPAKPVRSVLIPGTDTDTIAGIVLCIAGWMVLVYSWLGPGFA